MPFVDLNHDDVRRVRLASRFMGLRDRWRCRSSLLDADLVVSLPKLKTHHWAGMTCAEEPVRRDAGHRYGWPKNVLHFRGIENRSSTSPPPSARPGHRGRHRRHGRGRADHGKPRRSAAW